MKRFISSFLVISALLWFVSCGGPDQTSSSSSSASSVASSTASSVSSSTASSEASSTASSQGSSLPAGIKAIKIYLSAPDCGDNVVYIVGDLGALSTTTDMQNKLATWDPTSTKGQMTKNSTTGLWEITLYSDATDDASYQFKFVNGSPGYGGTWANEELEYKADNSTEGINNRVGDVLASDTIVEWWMTNEVTNTDQKDVTLLSKIVAWKGTGGTYTCSNVNFTIVVTPIITNDPVTVAQGDYIELWGSFNSWGGATTSNTVAANDSVTFTFTYTGAAAVDYQLRKAGFNGSYDTGANFGYVIPLSKANGGSVVLTNSGYWRSW